MFNITNIVLRLAVFISAFLMIICGFLQVFFRYVLRMPLEWSEELIRYLAIWNVFLAVPIGILLNSHASIDVITKRVPDKYKFIYEIFISIIEILAFLIMLYFGYKLTISNFNQYSSAMKIPMGFVFLSLPIGGMLGIVYTTKNLLNKYKRSDIQ